MSELQPTLTSENFEYRTDAAPLTDDTELAFHTSELRSVEEGLRAARAAIDAAQSSREQPPRRTAQQELTEMGRHLADLRAWRMELVEGENEPARSFRTALADFEQPAPTSYSELGAGASRQSAVANGDFSQWASEFSQRPSSIGADFEELSLSRR